MGNPISLALRLIIGPVSTTAAYSKLLQLRIEDLLDPTDIRGIEKEIIKHVANEVAESSKDIVESVVEHDRGVIKFVFADASSFPEINLDLELLTDAAQKLVEPFLACRVDERQHELENKKRPRVLLFIIET